VTQLASLNSSPQIRALGDPIQFCLEISDPVASLRHKQNFVLVKKAKSLNTFLFTPIV